jgi:hypothetical protein
MSEAVAAFHNRCHGGTGIVGCTVAARVGQDA